MAINELVQAVVSPAVTVGGHLLSDFYAKMQASPSFVRQREVETFQGRQRSTMLLLQNLNKSLIMQCKIDYFGTAIQRAAGQSEFEALFQSSEPVVIDIMDGFWYNAVLLSASESVSSYQYITTVSYQFRVTRHKPAVTEELEMTEVIKCSSNVDRTDCIITVSAGFMDGSDLTLTLNEYSWTIHGIENPNDEQIVLDGIHKVFKIGTQNAAQKIIWTDFPYLVPGDNTISVVVNGVFPGGVNGSIEYVPTFV